MASSKHFTGPEVIGLIDAPAVLTHPPDGGAQIDKAGITAVGPTPVEAAAEWGREFAEMIALPKG